MASKEEVRRVSVYINGSEADLTLKQLEKGAKKLRNELAALLPGTSEFKKKLEELKETKGILSDIDKDIRGVGGAWGWLKTEVGKLGVLATGYLGLEFITDQFKNIISQNAQFSDSIADIQKTTGLSEAEVRRLQSSFKSIDTRSSRAELNGLAEVAGKLGISGENDVLGFVRAADKINVALGKDLGNAEQAVNDLGKLAEIFKIKDAYGLEQALTKTGSAINDLGAIGTANEGYIVEFTKRLGGVAPAANISIQNIMALGAVMDELGQPVEAAATSIGQFITGMGQDIPRFAKIAKMSVADFSATLQKDGNQALIAVLKNLKSTGQGVQGLASSMGMIGEDGARATAALGLLSNNVDLLEKRQTLANNSFRDGVSLTNEYNVKNNNFAATLDKLSKKFNALTSNTTVTDFLVKGTEAASSFVDWLNRSMSTIAMLLNLVIAGAAGYIAYNTALKVATVTQNAWWATLIKSEAATKLIMVAETAWTALKLLFTGRVREARAAMIGFNAVIGASPIGLVVASVTALVAAMYLMNDEISDAVLAQQTLNKIQTEGAEKVAEEKEKIKSLTSIIGDLNETQENRILAVKTLRNLLPDHLKAYTDEQILAGKAKTAIDEYVLSLEKKAEAESAQQALTQLKKEARLIESQPGEVSWFQKAKAGAVGVFAGRGAGGLQEAKYAAENKEEELARNKAQQDAIISSYKTELKNNLLKPSGEGSGMGAAFDLATAAKGELERQLAADEKLLSTLQRGTAEYNKVAAEMVAIRKRIKEINKDTGVGTGAGGKDDPAAAKLKESKNLSQIVKDFNADALADLQKKNQKEIKDTENKYNALIDKEKNFLNDEKSKKYLSADETQRHLAEIAQLKADKEVAVNKVILQQEEDLNNRIRDLRTQLGDVYQTELDEETARINNFYDDLLDSGFDACEVEKSRAEDLANANIREAKRFSDAVEEIEEQGVVSGSNKDNIELARINKKYDDQIEALKRRFMSEKVLTAEHQAAIDLINKNREAETNNYKARKAKEMRDALIDGASNVANAMFDIGRNKSQAETDRELAQLDKLKDKELANKNLTEEQKAAINEKYHKQEAAIKLKAWEAQKSADMKQAIISGALAVVKALPNPFAAAAAGVAAAAEIAVIASTEPPEFYHGGYSAVDYNRPKGYVNKPTLFANSASGRSFSAGEKFKTEYIISSEQLRDPVVANFARMLDANRGVRQFEFGGYSAVTNKSSSYQMQSPAGTANNNNHMAEVAELRSIMVDFITKQAKINAIPVINDRRAQDIADARIAEIRRAANAG